MARPEAGRGNEEDMHFGDGLPIAQDMAHIGAMRHNE
jgi:hypothetical protein